MKKTPEELLNDALGALQPFYEEGDDGSAIRLALDAIAGLLSEHAGVGDESDDLVDVLRKMEANAYLVDTVAGLYDAAKGGQYGQGLRKDQVALVNNDVQDFYEPLTEFVLPRLKPKSKKRGPKASAPKKGKSR